jgi:HEPN/Toprim N-terminal domain 1
MSNYAQCWLGSFYVGSTRNDIDLGLMRLFQATDKNVMSNNGPNVPIPLIEKYIHNPNPAQYVAKEMDIVFYRAPVNVIRDRLNLQGYTLDTARAAFTECIKIEVQELRESCEEEEIGNRYEPHLEIIQQLNVDSWVNTLRSIRSKEHRPIGNPYAVPKGETLIGYMVARNWYGYNGHDLNVALRLALEAYPDAEEFIYDVTDLVLGGNISLDEEEYIEYVFSDPTIGKTIVLTEGKSDVWILSESLKLLYPHLFDNFSFMDFDGFRVGGGVGPLANIVKAFSGAGITNKVVALFDNDTAAEDALRGLKSVQIPSHICICKLPEIDFLRDYPTSGPSGLISMNVNGIAGSIELYLGCDALLDAGGSLTPVQWKGFGAGVGKYQGEVLQKDTIQQKFRNKLNACQEDVALIKQTDWDGVRAILECLLSAFHELDGKDICHNTKKYYGRGIFN